MGLVPLAFLHDLARFPFRVTAESSQDVVTAGTYALAQLLRALPRERITRAVGRLCDMELPPAVSRAAVGLYARAYRVDLDEAAPVDSPYPSFDAFFTRPLRPGARDWPVDAATLASPADGRLDAVGPVDGRTITVKGKPYDAGTLLGSDRAAERYRGGTFAVVYLSPRDYHRVHAPAAGRVVAVRSLPGELFPVNSVSERHIPRFLSRNRRVAIELETESFGRITVVMVAAMIVGRVTVSGVDAPDVPIGDHHLEPPLAREAGDEIGIFHLGSTAVVFLEPGKLATDGGFDRALGPILVGDVLARAAQSNGVNGSKEHPDG